MRMQGLEKETRVRKGDMSPDFWALCPVQDKSLDSKSQREEDAQRIWENPTLVHRPLKGPTRQERDVSDLTVG